MVWQAHNDPFGRASVTTPTVVNNLRFPGQYFDAETGLHYNYFRDYDPSLGRYIQSDPIGLAGGLNTYIYVEANPINKVDPKGLTGTIILSRPIVIPRPVPIPAQPIDPVIPVPVPDDAVPDDDVKGYCTRLYVRCVQEGWGGDWSCGQCHFFCTGINEVWPFEHCSPDFQACRQ